MKNYLLDGSFPQLFAAAGLNPEEVLRLAQLPEDLFSKPEPAVSGAGYLRLLEAVGQLAPTDDMAVTLATQEGVEQFSPPIFAAYCSRDGASCIARLSELKPLIGPVRYRLETLGPEAALYIESDEVGTQLPRFVVEGEIALILHVMRSATKQKITPVRIESVQPVSAALERLAGIPVAVSGVNAVTFTVKDLAIPFISRNESMWSYFEPELRRRLSQLEVDDSTAARVRAALVELLPTGETSIEDAARRLAVSSRTLQRRLAEEDTTFSKQLSHVRLLLAKQYLASPHMSTDSIAFMLGYQEANSFVRAFTLWTGRTPSDYRAEKTH
nr:AraC family transcriptional regulator [Actinomyces sp.]